STFLGRVPESVSLSRVLPSLLCLCLGKRYLAPNRSHLFGVRPLNLQHLVPELVVLRDLGRLSIAAGIKIIKHHPHPVRGRVVRELENVDAVGVLNLNHGASRPGTSPAAMRAALHGRRVVASRTMRLLGGGKPTRRRLGLFRRADTS